MPRSRFVSVGALTIAVSAVAGGVFGRGAAQSQDRLTENYRTFTAALSVDRVALRGQGRIRPAGLRRDLRHAADARSAFELHGSAAYAQLRERQEGRYYGLGITISGRRRRHHRAGASSKDRRRTSRASAAATSSPRSTARTRRAGRATRRSASCADRRARASRSSIKRPGDERLIPISVQRDEITIPVDSRRTSWSTQQTGYIRLQDFAENTDRDLGARSTI